MKNASQSFTYSTVDNASGHSLAQLQQKSNAFSEQFANVSRDEIYRFPKHGANIGELDQTNLFRVRQSLQKITVNPLPWLSSRVSPRVVLVQIQLYNFCIAKIDANYQLKTLCCVSVLVLIGASMLQY